MELKKQISFTFLKNKFILKTLDTNSINSSYLNAINKEKYLLSNKKSKFNYKRQKRRVRYRTQNGL